MNILVVNSGSSSIKYQLFNSVDWQALVTGSIERIGEAGSTLRQRIHGVDTRPETAIEAPGHREAFACMREALSAVGDSARPDAIGHRVVHGGESFHCPARVDATVIDAIRDTIPLAPLHNPSNLLGIEIMRAQYADLPQVAVFDTAFHQTMPPAAARYAIPEALYRDHGIRRYGFHGVSHHYVAERAAAFLGMAPESCNLITLHLGNGVSACAIADGKSVDTTMGMTPLEGLMMGTRSGDIDPGVIFYLARETGMNLDSIEALLNRKSGLRGVCGSNDMREIDRRAAQGDAQAGLAIDMFCHRLKKTIGAFAAELGRVDALVFTGGIGENAANVRRLACAGLERFGVVLDETRNSETGEDERRISSDQAAIDVLVIPTNEELEIARQTHRILDGSVT